MRRKVYIETTVVSYYTAWPSRDLVVAGRQEVTRVLWPRLPEDFDPYISALVLREAGQGVSDAAEQRMTALRDMSVLDITDEVRRMADRLIAGSAVPDECPEDALHIAVAAMNGMDFLLTWNFSYINNAFTRSIIRQVVENEGYQCPEVCSPEELEGDQP